MAVFLVTGGAGFIGSHLVDALLARGESVRIVDNFVTGRRENIAHLRGKVDLFEMSIIDTSSLGKAMRGVNYVFHEAALPSVPRSIRDPMESHTMAATGTLNVLRTAHEAGVKRVVYAGSSSAYGDVDTEFKSESMIASPLSPYAAAKLAGEHYCKVFWNTYGLETVSLRYFNVFGPRQDPTSEYSAVIPLFISKMLNSTRPTIYGDGTQSRDFTYVENVVHGNLLAIQAPAEKVAGEVINVACGKRTSVLDLIDALNEMLGMNVRPHFVPARAGDIQHSCADISKARALLGYESQVEFADGLARTLEWFKDYVRP